MRVCISTALVLALLSWSWPATASAQPLDPPRLRRPIAAAWIESGRLLAVANQKSGTVSIVDIPNRKVLDEVEIGGRLSDIAAIPKSGRLLVAVEQQNNLVLLEWRKTSLFPLNRVKVSPQPVDIAVAPDASVFTVTSLWSRKVSIWERRDKPPYDAFPYQCCGEVDLPFNAREQLLLPQDRAIIADAFGGSLAVVNLKESTVLVTRSIAGQNIRGLALGRDPEHLLVSHQRLLPVPATAENIQAGALIENLVGEFNVASLLDSEIAGPLRGFTYEVAAGGAGRADPAFVHRIDAARTFVTIAGLDEVRVLPDHGLPPYVSLPVQRGPRKMIFFDDQATIDYDWWKTKYKVGPAMFDVVVNTLSDSLSVIEWQEEEFIDGENRVKAKPRFPEPPFRRGEPKVVGEISLGPSPPLKTADRGEALFYDATLSADGWMSCHSCHTDGHTNGQLADTLGDGTHGTPKRIPTLLGTRLTDKWAWNGEVRELHEQVAKSLENTMHSPNFTSEQVMDLTAYLHTLPFPPPLQPATDNPADQAQLTSGEALFASLGCANCHVPPLTYTSQETYDVGLADEKGLSKFNPPSLRGVSQGYSFFHDSRAKTLEEVFTSHGHQLSRELSKEELADLLRFLRSL